MSEQPHNGELVIDVHDLNKHFGDKHVVNNLTMQVARLLEGQGGDIGVGVLFAHGLIPLCGELIGRSAPGRNRGRRARRVWTSPLRSTRRRR